jgi:hypothetical protein
LIALQRREALLALYFRRGNREADVGAFGISCARTCRQLPKACGRDRDTDSVKAPTKPPRFSACQRPIVHQDVM